MTHEIPTAEMILTEKDFKDEIVVDRISPTAYVISHCSSAIEPDIFEPNPRYWERLEQLRRMHVNDEDLPWGSDL